LVSRSSRGLYCIVAGIRYASEVIATNARKPIFGYRAMIMSIIAIGFYRLLCGASCLFLVWIHFWFSIYFTTLLIAIPSAVKAFNFITTLWKGNLQFNPAMLFAIG
jgi:cytochrome c oxidase subunit 1